METVGAPSIGALFDWDGGNGRVTGWIRELPEPTFDDEPTEWIREFLLEERARQVARETAPRMIWDDQSGQFRFYVDLYPRKRWEWVAREDATHVSYAGSCGGIAPIDEIVVTGMVDWSPEHVADAERRAERNIGQRVW